ncbi:MAG: tetratricopeptide repeat protein [Muribaculaceae bacterium]|nr:tetratricopeptide repeat protein [Muribaculaceae bacterium]
MSRNNRSILPREFTVLAARVWRTIAVLCCLTMVCGVAAAGNDTSVKAERNFIKDGNKAFGDGNYQKALDYYQKALGIAPASEAALFNKALSMVMLSGGQDSVMIKQAMDIYERLGKSAVDTAIKDKANYNLGNMAFNRQDYKQSIEYYKRVLRSNPSNMKARENLRVAQLKLPPEDQNQNQDQQQQQQDQQQEQQDQNQDQQDQQDQQQQPQDQQNGNSDQILQSMQNRENQTRKDTEKKEMNVGAASTDKPW